MSSDQAINGRAIVPAKLRDGTPIDVVVREVTVGELRAFLAQLPPVSSGLDDGLLNDLRLVDLPLFTSLSAADVDALRPSQLRQIAQVARDLNADFFGLLDRTRAAATLQPALAQPPSSTAPA